MSTTIADNIVATLAASGVQRVYGLPGDSINGFTEALRRAGTWRSPAPPTSSGCRTPRSWSS